ITHGSMLRIDFDRLVTILADVVIVCSHIRERGVEAIPSVSIIEIACDAAVQKDIVEDLAAIGFTDRASVGKDQQWTTILCICGTLIKDVIVELHFRHRDGYLSGDADKDIVPESQIAHVCISIIGKVPEL